MLAYKNILGKTIMAMILSSALYGPAVLLFLLLVYQAATPGLVASYAMSVAPCIIFGFMFFIFIQKNEHLILKAKDFIWTTLKFILICEVTVLFFSVFSFFFNRSGKINEFFNYYIEEDYLLANLSALFFGLSLPFFYRLLKYGVRKLHANKS